MSKEIILSKKREEGTSISDDMRYSEALYNWAERMERLVNLSKQ